MDNIHKMLNVGCLHYKKLECISACTVYSYCMNVFGMGYTIEFIGPFQTLVSFFLSKS